MRTLKSAMLFMALTLSATTVFAADYSSCENDQFILKFKENQEPSTRSMGYTKSILILQKSGGVPLETFTTFTESKSSTVYENQAMEFKLTVTKKGQGTLVLEGHPLDIKCE